MKLVAKYFKEALIKYRKEFTICLLFAIIVMAIGVIVPIGSRYYIMQIEEARDLTWVICGGAIFCLLYFARTLVNVLFYRALDKFGGAYMSHLSLLLEKSVQESKYEELKKMNEGTLRNILYTDVLNVFLTIGHHLPSIVCSFIMIVLLLAYLLSRDVWTAMIILAGALIGILLSVKSKKYIAKASKETNQMMKKFDANCTEFISLLPMIQTNDLLGYYQKKTDIAISDFISASRKADIPIEIWSGLVGSYHSLFSIILSAFLVWPIAGHNVVDMLFFTMIANMALSESQKISQLVMQVIKGLPSFGNVENVRKLSRADGEREVFDVEAIRFENVAFSYPDSMKKVFDGIDLELRKGDTVCIKGMNGAGKSTFYKLITGLYGPTGGNITVDGIGLSEIKRSVWNKQVLYISQDEKCLNENIKKYIDEISGQEISDDDIERWSELVCLNCGDKTISGNGDSLSGGQRKKLYLMKILARAAGSSIIIADELAAGMDAETVPIMQKVLDDYAKSREKIIFVTDHQNYANVSYNVVMNFEGGDICVKRIA